ncbi:unnamed protein product, partial [Leptidea sinapis]
MNSKFCLFLVICCAVASASPQGRIAGGEAAEVESHPYMTALVYYYPRPDIYIQRCVGPLISSWHVLTTAYCFNGAEQSNFQVRAGSTKSMEGGSVTSILEVIEHPDYVLDPRENDIAVVLLATPFSVSDVTNPLLLPPPNVYLPVGTLGTVTGWGFEVLDSLKTVTLRTIPLDTCQKAYEGVIGVSIQDSAGRNLIYLQGLWLRGVPGHIYESRPVHKMDTGGRSRSYQYLIVHQG